MSPTLHYHPLAAFCQKVLIALYENETPFETVLVDLGNAESRAAFTALWPTGKMPVLRDEIHDRTVPESTIVIEYLDQRYPGPRPLLPADPALQLEARLWDRLSDQYVMAPMQTIVLDRLQPAEEREPRRVDTARATLDMAYDMLERQLTGKTWIVGDSFSIADCAAAPALFYAGIAHPFPQANAQLAAYFERLVLRSSVRRVLEEARPYFEFFPLKDSIPARFLEPESVH